MALVLEGLADLPRQAPSFGAVAEGDSPLALVDPGFLNETGTRPDVPCFSVDLSVKEPALRKPRRASTVAASLGVTVAAATLPIASLAPSYTGTRPYRPAGPAPTPPDLGAARRVYLHHVLAFRNRPLDSGPYTFLWVDALAIKVREGGRTVNVHALIAVGVNADGHREVLGLEVASCEDGAGWLGFLRSLTARGLAGVKLVVSDAHRGLVDAIAATLPGAAWQRCRTHYLRNLLTKVPRSAQPWVATMVRTIFDQPDAAAVRAQYARVVEAIEATFPDAATHLDEARDDLLAFAAFPHELWRQIWSNNPQQRLNKEIRRRTDVVGIFPNRAAIIRLVGAVLAEQTDEWTEQRRYMGIELLAKTRLTVIDGHATPAAESHAAAIAA